MPLSGKATLPCSLESGPSEGTMACGNRKRRTERRNQATSTSEGSSQIVEGPQREASTVGGGRSQLLVTITASVVQGGDACSGTLRPRDSFPPNLTSCERGTSKEPCPRAHHAVREFGSDVCDPHPPGCVLRDCFKPTGWGWKLLLCTPSYKCG